MIKAVFIIVAVMGWGNIWAAKLFAQEPSVEEQQQTARARPFDSYAGINSEDLMARLDNLAIELQKDLDLKAHIIVYGPKGEGGGTGNQLLRMTIDYLINTRGIDETRIAGIYSG